MKLFGILYVVFGLMAVIGSVLDADGVMAAIRRLPTKWMDRICEKMYKFIMEHRPGLLMKFDLPHVDTIPKDRLYQIDFRIDEADVEWMRKQGQTPCFFEKGVFLCPIQMNWYWRNIFATVSVTSSLRVLWI